MSLQDNLLSRIGNAHQGPRKRIALDLIDSSPHQPRRFFDAAELTELAESIKAHGVLSPPLVRPSGERFTLIAGERRVRAARMAGLAHLEVVFAVFEESEDAFVALSENLDHKQLSPYEESRAMVRLLEQSLQLSEAEVIALLKRIKSWPEGIDQDVRGQVSELFKRAGMGSPQSFVSNRLKLLAIDSKVLERLEGGRIPYTVATELLKVSDETARHALLERILLEGLTLEQVRQEIAGMRVQPPSAGAVAVHRTLFRQLQQGYAALPRNRQGEVDALLEQIQAILRTP